MLLRCRKNRLVLLVAVLVTPLMTLFSSIASGKMMAEIQCKNTEEKLVYDCMISLMDMKTSIKVKEAVFNVSADMPSMPGAHNVKPIMAHSMGMGMYHVRLALEMYGEWALKLDFTKPRRDRIIKKMNFGKHGMVMKNDHKMKHNHMNEGKEKGEGKMKISHDHGKMHKQKND